ncbi:MAG: DMT family transporter [Oscillospiraceae bacterium]|nr:DMT family transporter [Oscillospiraceae bacterium]MBR6616714.1 DMT family transporter [Oscillospiraceae bacterium]
MKAKYKGLILVILSAFCFALMNLFVRLSGDLPSIQKSFFRNFIALFIALFLLIRDRKELHFQKDGLGFLLLRSIFGTIGVLCNFYAVDHLVLSDASMLNKLSPTFSILFSWLLLKEKLRPAQGAAVLIAFLGSLMIIKPTLDFSDFAGSAAGFTSGVFAGAAYCMVRTLGKKGMHKTIIVAFFSGFSCLVTLPFLLLDFHPMTPTQILLLIGAGLAAAGGQFTITAAYCQAPAKEISIYNYSQIIFSALLGLLLFQEMPDGWSFLGYTVIIFTALWMFYYNNRKPQNIETQT